MDLECSSGPHVGSLHCPQIQDHNGLDFSFASAAAQAAFRSALAAANGDRFPSTLLLQHIVTVPGCVLLMAKVVEVEPAAALEVVWAGAAEGAVAASVPAYDGAAWAVISSTHSSSSGMEHISCNALDELLQEGVAAAALQQALLHQVAGNGPSALAAHPGGGGCGVVAGWGQQLQPKLFQLSPVQQLEQQHQQQLTGSSSSSERGAPGGTSKSSSGMVRVVISRGDKVLSDRLEQVVSAQHMGSACSASAAGAAAAGSGGDETAGARDGSFVLLILPSVIPSSSGAGCGGGGSSRDITAAALTVALLQQTSLGAAAKSGPSAIAVSAQQTASAAASASVAAAGAYSGGTGVVGGIRFASAGVGAGADGNHVPVANITVLLLPPEVADELEAWVLQQQLSVHEMTPLLRDLALCSMSGTLCSWVLAGHRVMAFPVMASLLTFQGCQFQGH